MRLISQLVSYGHATKPNVARITLEWEHGGVRFGMAAETDQGEEGIAFLRSKLIELAQEEIESGGPKHLSATGKLVRLTPGVVKQIRAAKSGTKFSALMTELGAVGNFDRDYFNACDAVIE